MHIHILGLSGTFMSALALLAKKAGFSVTGSDENCYPPISNLLSSHGISWTEGYEDSQEALKADCVIVGNAIKRGMPVIEHVLNQSKAYMSGPQWLYENILSRYRVIAVSGTHGKTTTTSMLAYILSYAGLEPGFLIGGVAANFNTSAQLGSGEWFVIEADEYDSAFFDKRPKFMHYRPELAIINNLEFDHADIYPDLEAIQQQFHYLLKTIPQRGLVLKPAQDEALQAVFEKGTYCAVQEFSLSGNPAWRAELVDDSGRFFNVLHHGQKVCELQWGLIGSFNVENALAAIAASFYAGVSPEIAAQALAEYQPVKRRLEIKAEVSGVTIYDDFAHHPTAIARTIDALQKSARHRKIYAVLECASYTMRTGVHALSLEKALSLADEVLILNTVDFDLENIAKKWRFSYALLPSTDAIVTYLTDAVDKGDAILVMSNRGFNNIYKDLEINLKKINRFTAV